ncbi:hypothetical protein HAX54_053095 [Datura stramonium]|uniref:Uncharacterized protein n=1 Tax=Datura stramonium TaxID=4076 RepID=A0ABS8WU36_DATST|nr:hypothetical protein [Datura stramonium]
MEMVMASMRKLLGRFPKLSHGGMSSRSVVADLKALEGAIASIAQAPYRAPKGFGAALRAYGGLIAAGMPPLQWCPFQQVPR